MPSKKDQLRKRLQDKIAAKKALRGGLKTLKKPSNHVFKLNDNESIRRVCVNLMSEIAYLNSRGCVDPQQVNKILAPKYEFFVKHYLGMYLAIIKQQLPIEVLDMMLSQKHKIDTRELSEKEASLQMGAVISKKLNIDVDALVKSAEANKAAIEAEESKKQ